MTSCAFFEANYAVQGLSDTPKIICTDDMTPSLWLASATIILLAVIPAVFGDVLCTRV